MGGVIDTFKGLLGGTTKAEKEAKVAASAQQASLFAIQKEEQDKLDKRRSSMERAKSGRASLLSGTETGVAPTDLKTTLG